MVHKKVKVLIRSVVFFIVFSFIFAKIQDVFMLKDYAASNLHGFYNLEENSLDIIFYGSSHAYCTFNPTFYKEQMSIDSYVLASAEQPLSATYYNIKESLRTQKPKIIVLEIYMASFRTESIKKSRHYQIASPMKFSTNKLELVDNLSQDTESYFSLLFHLFLYHTRWNNLTINDYTFFSKEITSPNNGYIGLEKSEKVTVANIENETSGNIIPENLNYLNKLVELTNNEGIELVFVYAPFPSMSDNLYESYRGIKNFAIENNIEFYDGWENFETFNFDLDSDFYDSGHLNVNGGKKFNAHFTEYLEELLNNSN